MAGFSEDLAHERESRKPEMALRASERRPDEMDDIVVKGVEMFRAEAMSDDVWWMCCYFRNGERVTFHVTHNDERISVSVTETPSEWIDIDERRRQTGH